MMPHGFFLPPHGLCGRMRRFLVGLPCVAKLRQHLASARAYRLSGDDDLPAARQVVTSSPCSRCRLCPRRTLALGHRDDPLRGFPCDRARISAPRRLQARAPREEFARTRRPALRQWWACNAGTAASANMPQRCSPRRWASSRRVQRATGGVGAPWTAGAAPASGGCAAPMTAEASPQRAVPQRGPTLIPVSVLPE